MATTEVSYTAPATYTITFEYLERTDVKVTVDNVLQTEGTSNDYTFTDATTLAFNVGQEPTAGAIVRVYRDTDTLAAKATYFPGSAIRSQDLNDNQDQVLYSVQEIENHSLNRYGENAIAGDIDVGGNRLKNLKDEYTSTEDPNAADNDDAASHGWVRKFFFDVKAETRTGAEYDSEPSATKWPNDDLTVATTSAVTKYIDDKNDALLTVDVHEADGVKVTDNSPGAGQITIGLHDDSVDFSKIKNADIVNKAEQDTDGGTIPSAYVADDTKIPTMAAIIARHDNYVQDVTPTAPHQIGQFWFSDTNDKTLAVWNGSGWIGIASGGTFITQPKLIWVDDANGNDANDGHRVIKPMKTIKAAVASASDGDMIYVQPGVYDEALPIDLGSKKNISIVGMSMRSVFVHPTAATENNDMFLLGSGCLVSNLTLYGLKVSGATRDANGVLTSATDSIDPDTTHGVPNGQNWFFKFSSDDGDGNAIKFTKSPYIQNITAFADTNANNATFDPTQLNQPGFAGDITSGPTGGGLLVDGNVPHADSPLRSILTDAYTLICLDGPGVLVTNGGYAQLVSTFGTFAHYHAKTLNGGQINMSNCTTDFGRFGLIADGKSGQLFTANTNALANSGQKVVVVGTSSNAWRAQANPNPADHMLCEVTYNDSSTEFIPIANVVVTSGTVKTITLASNLAKPVLSGTTLKFYLRSLITTGGHVFEFCGSGTDYLAHPDNGGQPVEANQVVDKNNGKVYISSTDHNGKFKVGDVFTVDTDSQEARYNGTVLASSATTDTTDASNISTGTLNDARLPAATNTGTFAHPQSVTVSAGGRVTAITAGSATQGVTYEAVDDGLNAKLQLKEDGTVIDEIKLVASSGQVIDVDNAGQITLSSPNSTTANVNITATPPASPDAGEMWWDSDTGDSYIYYNDGNTSQWVQFAPQQTGTGNGTVTTVTAGTGLTGGVISTTGTIALANTAATTGSFGSATQSAIITVDQQGRITASSETDIALDASDVTSGTFDLARIPQLTDAKLPTSISTSRIPNLSANKITSDTFATGRIPRLNGDGSATSTYLESLAADLSPQLGANLDVAGFDITSTSNGNIDLNPNGTGEVVSKNGQGFTWGRSTFVYQLLPPDSGSSWTLKLPTSVGSANQYLKTNGSDQLSWDTETTYDLTGADDSGDFRIRLAGTNSTNDDVKIKAGSGISLDNSTSGETTISATADAIPAGCIQTYAGTGAIPSGWLECNGQVVNNTAYPALLAAIGLQYTAHQDPSYSFNSATQFVIPDLRGEFIRGLDDRSTGGVDPSAPRTQGSSQGDLFKSHYHSASRIGTNGGNNAKFGSGYGTASNTNAAGGAETRPRNIAFKMIIKT
jgi:microcystin-dependent protein